MQKRNKNNSSKKIEIHQFKSNFFIGDDNNFKVLNLKSFSKVDLDTENVTIIHFNKPPVIVPNKLFIKDNLNKYLSTNYKLSNNLSVGYDETSNKSLNIVYEKKKNLENLLDKNGIEFISINYFTGIYEYLTLLKKNDEMSIYINLRNSLFDIIISNRLFLRFIYIDISSFFFRAVKYSYITVK